MAASSWDHPIKFEDSPAESFISTPGDSYPSLFETPAPGTMNPVEMLSPQSISDNVNTKDKSSSPTPDAEEEDDASAETSAGDKKTKKRKSWGQVLPEPKTNLPPRKRAKTEDEKEQRRVERVLRNRRAAQSSRERKRLEVEALERKNKELEDALSHARQTNLALAEELKKFRRDSGARSSSPFDTFNSPVTLSAQLFAGHELSEKPSNPTPSSLVEDMINSTTQTNVTVNPASLSPALSPVPETDEAAEEVSDKTEAPSTPAPSSDLAQHPAVSSVGGDAAVVDGLADLSGPAHMGLVPSAPELGDDHLNGAHFGLAEALDADRYVLESGLLSSPNSVDYENDYLACDSAFLPVDPFDISEFLHDEGSNNNPFANDAMAQNDAAEPLFGLGASDLETQVSSENSNLQPHSGASSSGCDDGGIAVGI